MRGLCWLLLVSNIYLGASSIIPSDERCVTAIYTAYGYINFAGSPSVGFWDTRCLNPLKVTSIYASSQVHCSPSEQAAGLSQLATLCREVAGLDLIPRDQLAANLTETAIQRMQVVGYGEIPRNLPLDAPVVLSTSHYDRTFRTIDAWQFEMWSHFAYGFAGYGFWAAVLAVGTLHRFIQQFLLSRRASMGRQQHPLVRTFGSPFRRMYSWIHTHLVVASPLPSHGRHILWWTFPTRVEAVVTFTFWVISIVLCMVGYRTFSGNIYWPDISAQLLRYAADRTGILSFANLPLLWLFAGRNNIFLWATGWSFATFNIFHRHVAWIATIQALIHTILYLILFIQNGNAWKKLQKPYLFWGTVAMVAMALVLPSAVDWFRRRSYETFLLLHIAFSVATVIGCFYHTTIFEGHEYWLYLWPVIGVWAFDRFLRLVRLIYCNFYVRVYAGRELQYSRSLATYDEASDVIRLEVMPGSTILHPTAGQYYYLYQPFRLTGWESHPFTLGTWSFETGSRTSSVPSDAAKRDQTVDVSQIPLLADSSGSESQSLDESSQESNQLKLIFWIRPFDGWTRSLRHQCKACPDRGLDTTILLEGPYGEEFPLWNYESILFVAGGTGIAAIVPYIQDHLARCATADGNATQIQDMQLVWTTRQAAFVRQLATGELNTALTRSGFHASFYVTSPGEGHIGVNSHPSSQDDGLLDKDLEIHTGRPDLQNHILAHAHEAQLRDCSALVLVCGPPAMADEARSAVYRAMRQGYRGIRYVEESFSW
ncbi:FRE family ferric-chelate reductase [Aspergillus steynii IBT 23096]|uniref:FRE family ferric-chelate reductase n=1 Tax=Aspergillus steynii IBT 23096 TaxID=1392250 RepID=A0A2I2G3N9_9EURO|nr:FRE family ferric-chelate reductase [Aspergillus steynii IBT 23096]PLB47489.1 FRE family ferric-chelate reductase [Aspergillus steynii IBT 23096]